MSDALHEKHNLFLGTAHTVAREPGARARVQRFFAMSSGYTPEMLRTTRPYQSIHADPRFQHLSETDR